MARSGQAVEVPQMARQVKITPFWPENPKSWFSRLQAQFALYNKVLDVVDDEEEILDYTPYSALKSKILNEYEISTQDKIESRLCVSIYTGGVEIVQQHPEKKENLTAVEVLVHKTLSGEKVVGN
ncbi:unnamed protein product [Lepeophtheirus salmonis]|uniref:(salmon louse) hypothetical protein n=1 Tax=Lepeophtheirus salmonis TaxID=72036 RepID=A0A7R8H952_LEPSM|nr:unnamed protein product [Lepeophtheirus salmonis]CAF2953069.1 unnamed protein product [Lepeophtheirus salmonis]